MQNRIFQLLVLLLVLSTAAVAQVTAPVAAPSDERPEVYAIKAGTVYVTPDRKLTDATILVRDGRIVEVGTSIAVPPEAVRIDVQDKTIVPAFIDLSSAYGQPEVERSSRDWMRPQYDSKTDGAYAWNEALKSAYSAAAHFTTDAKRAEALRKFGFATVLSHRPDGISRGSAAVVALSEKPEQEALLKAQAAHILSFSKGSSNQMYPGSLMGMIALLRQTYLDSEWYQKGGKAEERNLSLDAWNSLQSVPQFFSVGDELEALRAITLGQEFGKQYILMGDGNSYQRLDGYRQNQRFVVPLNFPDAYDVSDAFDAQMVSYEDMLHWELADANAVYLTRAGHQVAFTLDKLGKDEKTFFERLARVHAAGMSDADLLRALTATPASYLNMQRDLGSLENGRIANLTVLDAWPVSKDTKVYQTWVQGQPFEHQAVNADMVTGDYRIDLNGKTAAYQLKVEKGNKAKVAVGVDTNYYKANLSVEGDRVSLNFPADTTPGALRIRLSGMADKLHNLSGMGYDANGNWVSWSARYDDLNASMAKDDADEAKPAALVAELPLLPKPFAAYGRTVLPKGEDFIIRNATVWTNEAEGILETGDVYVRNGKIAGVGTQIKFPADIRQIDGTGMHLTCGIIDEHSHIAVSRGVNEGSQESTAEVRIGDVINSEDVNIYRHLAGGVTAMQQLHGSANPIGGQSSLIKLRYGALPEDLKIKGADGFIKFALGENVKQSNCGSAFTTRYPQTRMGVEQVFDDYFTRATAYAKTRAANPNTRRDLDLEAIAEIVNKERFITCHSYRQSEINMLMKVAERHNFRVNTFTHILEGYKVADKMAEHGVGASTFSDWWAYKFEVWDAIPENGAIMHEQGVTVGFNSDDAELGRRLNQEAGKAVQFGNVSEEDAWKFVTLNPAKLLHLDDRMGSIKVGKDADLVLWNNHPMSVYARAEKTWVDGTLYFDRADATSRRQEMQQERNRLAQSMLDEKNAGKRTQPVEGKGGEHWECDSMIHGH